MTAFEDDLTGQWAYGAFSGDGKRIFLLSNGEDFEPLLTVVDIDPDVMTDAVCATVRRSLSADEWRQITGTEPPAALACQDQAPARPTDASPSSTGPAPATPSEPAVPSQGSLSGWITVLDSKPKSDVNALVDANQAVATFGNGSSVPVQVVDTDFFPSLTPGYWAVAIVGSATEEEARQACSLVGREPGPACYPRSLG